MPSSPDHARTTKAKPPDGLLVALLRLVIRHGSKQRKSASLRVSLRVDRNESTSQVKGIIPCLRNRVTSDWIAS